MVMKNSKSVLQCLVLNSTNPKRQCVLFLYFFFLTSSSFILVFPAALQWICLSSVHLSVPVSLFIILDLSLSSTSPPPSHLWALQISLKAQALPPAASHRLHLEHGVGEAWSCRWASASRLRTAVVIRGCYWPRASWTGALLTTVDHRYSGHTQ